jgi:hypothetical protein
MVVQDPTLRQSFPSWRLADGAISGAIVDEGAKRLAALGATGTMELMSQQLLSRLVNDRMPMLSRGLSTPTIAPADRLFLSDTVHNFVVPLADGRGELRYCGGQIALSAEELGWLTRLDEGVSLRELGAGEQARAFCQKLANLGLVTVQPMAAMKAAE